MTIPGLGLLAGLFAADSAQRADVGAAPAQRHSAEGGTEAEFAAVLMGALGAEPVAEGDRRPFLGVFEALAHGGEEGDGGHAHQGDPSPEGAQPPDEADVAEVPADTAVTTDPDGAGEPAEAGEPAAGGASSTDVSGAGPEGEDTRSTPPSGPAPPTRRGGGAEPRTVASMGATPPVAAARDFVAGAPSAHGRTGVEAEAPTRPTVGTVANVGRTAGRAEDPSGTRRPLAGEYPGRDLAVEDELPSAAIRSVRAAADAEPVEPTREAEAVTESGGSTGADALEVNRDPNKMHPELRDRVQRVTERMQQEFGHRVEVVEGLRTPERQAHLFDQGRSRSGPIVTWTRESRHMEGRAADLRVDGTWHDPVAYGRLQKVAREEGLVTLGPRDPGHVELATDTDTRTASVASADEVARPAQSERLAAGSGMARVARVAAVARPAGLARPARVAVPGARVRSVGSPTEVPTGPGEGETPTIRTAGVPASAFMVDAEAASLDGEGGRRGNGHPQQQQSRRQPPSTGPAIAASDRPRPASGSDEFTPPLDAGRSQPTATDLGALADELIGDVSAWSPAIESSSFARELASVTGPDTSMIERLDKIEQMKEAARLGGPGELRLDLDEREGLGARIRMALRGSSLETRIDMDDPLVARRMQARITELHKALEAKGLEPAALDVRAVRPTTEGSDVAAALRNTPGVDARKVTAASSSQGSEPGAQREQTDRQADDGRREWREFLDGSGRDHRRERDGD